MHMMLLCSAPEAEQAKASVGPNVEPRSPPHSPRNFSFVVEDVTAVVNTDLTTKLENAVQLASSYLGLMIPNSTATIVDVSFLRAFLEACATEFVKDEAVIRAREHVKDYVPDPEMLQRDTRHLLERCGGSLELLASQRIQESCEERFNERRAARFSHTCEFPRLSMLVSEGGAAVQVPEGFVPQPPPDVFRKLHTKLGNVVMAHVEKLWRANKVLVLQEDAIPADLLSIMHFLQSHWTPDHGKLLGRWLADATNGVSPTSPVLNSPEAFAMAEDKYGVSTHPSMEQVVLSWYTRSRRDHRPLGDYRIWLIDIVSAFSQFSFRPQDVHYLCIRVALNLVVVLLVGFFGLSYCPLIYAIFSRTLDEAIALVIIGIVSTYCDDSIGFSPAESAASDFETAQAVCRDMFGEEGVSIPKLFPPASEAVVPGWLVNLMTELLLPSDRAIRKLAFVFFVVVDTAQPRWPLPVCQVVASLAQRYSFGVRGMKPHVASFNHLLAGDQSRFCLRNVTSSALFCVEMWRVAIIMLLTDPVPMAVKMSTLVRLDEGPPSYRLITDAGPDGLGAVVRDAYGSVICYSDFHLRTGGGRLQNAAEYAGFILALLLLIEVVGPQIRGSSVQWTTDSSTALSWVKKGRCSGLFAQLAFMALTAIVLKYDLKVLTPIKIPGLLMCDVDNLSRFSPTPTLPLALRYEAEANPAILALFEVVDPTKQLSNLVDHHLAYRRVHSCVAALRV